MRTLVLLLTGTLLCSCSTIESITDFDALKSGLAGGSQKVASATASGAGAVGKSVGTAYRGVNDGFAPPESNAFGSYPRDYVNHIRKHMLRHEGVEKTASFQFGTPVKSYVNKGLLQGGAIEWQGWAVDVSVATKTRFGQPDVVEYVVRMKDDEVVDVVEKEYAGALRRVSDDATTSGPAAPRR